MSFWVLTSLFQIVECGVRMVGSEPNRSTRPFFFFLVNFSTALYYLNAWMRLSLNRFDLDWEHWKGAWTAYTLGSLIKADNDDDAGYENITKKRNLFPFKLNRVCLDLLYLSNMGHFSWRVDFLRTLSRFKLERKIRSRMFTSSIKRCIIISRFYVVAV